MQNYLSKIKEWLNNQHTGKLVIKQYVLYFVAILLLFSLSLLVAKNTVGGVDFYVKWSSARAIQAGEASVYSNTVQESLIENAESFIYFELPENNRFTAPIFTLFLYYPFALIQDFELARSLWITICVIFLLVGIKQPEKKDFKQQGNHGPSYFLQVFITFNIFSIISLISGDALIITLALLLIALRHARKGNHELAGIFCGLATIQPVLALLWVILLSIIGIREGKWGALIWYLITTMLLILSGFILQAGWTIEYLQIIITTIRALPEMLQIRSIDLLQFAKILVPLVILIIEWIRSFSHIERPQNNQWLFNLSLVLFAILALPLKPESFLLTIPAWVEIFNEWNKRENASAKVIGFVNLGVYLILSGIFLLTDQDILVNRQPIPTILAYLSSIHVLVNMYWIRGWLKQDEMKNYIEPA